MEGFFVDKIQIKKRKEKKDEKKFDFWKKKKILFLLIKYLLTFYFMSQFEINYKSLLREGWSENEAACAAMYPQNYWITC